MLKAVGNSVFLMGPVKARMGLMVWVASCMSFLFLAVTILGMVGSCAVMCLNPSSMMMSVLVWMSWVMSFSVSFVVSVFFIVASSFCETPTTVCAPA